MTEVGFYHLRSTSLERALPRLLERAVAEGHRVVVMAGSPERVQHLDDLLWTYSEESFLPHGAAKHGHAERQPIWLTTEDENPNGARSAVVERYARCCDMFDGNDEAAVASARERWRAAKAAGHRLVYWEQVEGRWEKRATGESG